MKFLRFVIILFIAGLFSGFCFSQTDTSANVVGKGKALLYLSDGKQKFYEGNIKTALIKFREAINADKSFSAAYYWVAKCHLALKNYEFAQKYAEDALSIKEDADKELFYLLGSIYHVTNDLDKAVEFYSKNIPLLTENRISELRLNERIEECKRAKLMMADSLKIQLKVMGEEVNSKFADYAPVLSDTGKTLYFVSRREDTHGGGVNPYDNQYYEDIYVSFYDSKSRTWSNASNTDELVDKLNSKGFDAINHITFDGKQLYLTVNTDELDKDIKPKTNSSDLYYSKLSNKDNWNGPRDVGKPINTNFFEAGCTMPLTGDAMYFVSERKKGGLGQADIWLSTGDGKRFTEPKNIGTPINTPHEENTPFITPDNQYLFFSSNGHEGIGGYDIYVSKNMGDRWTKPVNVGYPINSVNDDLHFVYYKELNKAFLSTIPHIGGKGQRDIVEIDFGSFDFIAYLEKLIKEVEEN